MTSAVHFPERLSKSFVGCYTQKGAEASNFFEKLCYNSLFSGVHHDYDGGNVHLVSPHHPLIEMVKLVGAVVLLPLFVIALIARTACRLSHKHDLRTLGMRVTDTRMQKPIQSKKGDPIVLKQGVKLRARKAGVSFKKLKGGAFQYAQSQYSEGKVVGLGVAGNRAAPAGLIGKLIESGNAEEVGTKIYDTQEENMYAVALRTEATAISAMIVPERNKAIQDLYEEALRFNPSYRNRWAERFVLNPSLAPELDGYASGQIIKLIFDTRVSGRYGMVKRGNSADSKVFQMYADEKREVDFSVVKDREFSGGVCVHRAQIPKYAPWFRGIKNTSHFRAAADPKSKKIPVLFINAAWPNANKKAGGATGDMRRTVTNKAHRDYHAFKEYMVETMVGKMKAAAEAGVDIYIENTISLYAGKWRKNIERDFKELLQRAMDREITIPGGRVKKPATLTSHITPSWWPFGEGDRVTLGHCFDKIAVVDLDKTF